MGERIMIPESLEVLKGQALAAYKPFVEKGVTNPDDIDPADPANDLFSAWINALDESSGSDPLAQLRARLEKNLFYVDAGFTDPEYLEEVYSGIAEDASRIPLVPEDDGVVRLKNDYIAAEKRVRALW